MYFVWWWWQPCYSDAVMCLFNFNLNVLWCSSRRCDIDDKLVLKVRVIVASTIIVENGTNDFWVIGFLFFFVSFI